MKKYALYAITNVIATGLLAQTLFEDDFENGLSNWDLIGAHAIQLVKSEDPDHKSVLKLDSDGFVLALIKESSTWKSLAIEGEMLFPDDAHNYLGFVYNYKKTEQRSDFGSVYIKGNGSYIRVNPLRDSNVSRLLFEEYKTPLEKEAMIVIGEWKKFRFEVIGSECHLYVGNMDTPQLTFPYYQGQMGQVGFQPRVTGWPVHIDNIKVTHIDAFSYDGNPIPNIDYKPDSLITDWEYAGPFGNPQISLERPHGKETSIDWKKFNTDGRGAVITGRITEYDGEREVAYFRTFIQSETDREVTLHISSIDEIGLFVNKRFYGFIYRMGYISGAGLNWNAWYDFWENEQHEGRRVTIDLKKGANEIMVRVKNGHFASGGFFMRLE